MEIYLIRHTAVIGSKSICYGQINPPLAETFMEEAAAIKAKLPTDFDAVYSSPLLRCKHLAAELGYKNIQLEDALMEVNFGTWEGKPWNEIPPAELNPWMADFVNMAPPEGESLMDLHHRVLTFLTKVKASQNQKVAFFSHAGPIRSIIAHLQNIPLPNIFDIKVEMGAVILVIFENRESK